MKIIYFKITKNKNYRGSYLKTKKFGLINWEPNKDWVIQHFYTPQIEIITNDNEEIKYIVDLGANIGIETLRFMKLYPKANFYSVEASLANYLKLKNNTEKYKNIKILNKAIWSHNNSLEIDNPKNNNESFCVKEKHLGSKEIVQAITMKNLIAAFNLKKINILKIDIEGAERELFNQDCLEWLKIVDCFIIEVPDNDCPGVTQLVFEKFIEAEIKINTYINGENLVIIRKELNWQQRIKEFY